MKILSWIKNKFSKKIPSATGRRIDFRKCYWGHNIMSMTFDEQTNMSSCLTICTPLPSVGDDLILNTKSGKVGICRVMEVEPCGDPRDMANVKFGCVGYLEEETKPNNDSIGWNMLR